jgi:hypothetical protein
MQEPALKVLNKLAYSTYKYGTDTSGADITETVIPTGSPTTGAQAVDRYGAVKTMIEHWYGDGGTNFPQATFTDYTDAAPPAGWQSQPASAPLYHTVFARNCRTCHVVNADPGLQFSGLMESQLQANQLKDGYAKFMDEFATTTAGPNKGVLYLTQQGIMPFARLTLDRFWVDFDNGTSSGNTLAQALQMQAALAGQPVINATIQPSNKPLQPGQTASATTSSSARVDATASDFVAKFNWSLSVTPLPASDNDTSKPPVCSTSSAGAAVAVVGDTTASPGFYVGKSGLYRITLTPDNGVGQSGSASSYEYDICAANFVPTWTPAASPSCTAVKAPYQSSGAGGQQALPLNSCFAGAGNPPYSLKLSSDAQNYGLSASGPVVAPNGPTWNAAVLCDGLLATGPCATVPSAQFNFNANASPTSAVPVYYQLCDVDNDCTATGTGTTSSAVLSVAPTSVSIANASLKMYWAPCLDSYIDDVTNHATHCHNPGNLGSAFSGQLSGNYQLILGQNPSTSAPPGASMSHLYDAMTLGGAGNALQVSIVPPSMTAFGGMALPLQDSAVNLQSDLAQVLLVPASAYTNYSGQSLPFVTSDINGLSLTDGASAAALPALSYTLTAVGTGNGTTACNGNFSAGSSTCANGTLNIQALTSFTRSTASQTQPIFGTPAKNGNPAVTGIMASCSGSTCHSGTGNVWTYVPGDSQTTYNNICNSGSGAGTTHNCANPVKDASNNAIIVPGAPESSIFYTAACTTGFGTGPSRMITAFPSPAATQCQIIYQWILEGAAND